VAYSNYTQVEEAVADFAPFKGNTARGFWEGLEYRVMSYGATVAVYNRGSGQMWVASTRYSKTTSRLQNIVRRAWGLPR